MHWIVVWLASLLQKEDILIYTSISLHSVEWIIKYFEEHHNVQVWDKQGQKNKKKLHMISMLR
jgi:hypothetical protein